MMTRIVSLVRKLRSPDAIAKIARRLRVMAIARSVIRANPLFKIFSRQLRLRRLPYGSRHTAIVIGVGGGIGEAVARQLLQQGCRVIGTYRDNVPSIAETDNCHLFQLNITSSEQVCAVYEQIEKLGLFADLIVVATGLNSRLDYHASLSKESLTQDALAQEAVDILDSFRSNTLGPYLVVRRFAGLLVRKTDGRGVPQICLLSSSLGTMNNELYGGMYGYRVSKGALHALAMAMYCDLNLDGRVGMPVLGPGNVATGMNPGGLMSPNHAAREIVTTLEYSANRAVFQFLGVGGKRIAW